VIEVLDKIDAASFGMQDMELLGIFARQAAIAIRAAQHQQHLGQALLAGMQRLVEEGTTPALPELERLLGESEESGSGMEQILALADILGALSRLGPAERETCLKILTTFAEYAQSRSGLRPQNVGTEYPE
jgi:GAF domain-containing protein